MDLGGDDSNAPIPIDDDDWLSPHLPQALMQLPAARLALWEVLPLHVDANHCFSEQARAFLDPQRPLAEQVVLSCELSCQPRLVSRCQTALVEAAEAGDVEHWSSHLAQLADQHLNAA